MKVARRLISISTIFSISITRARHLLFLYLQIFNNIVVVVVQNTTRCRSRRRLSQNLFLMVSCVTIMIFLSQCFVIVVGHQMSETIHLAQNRKSVMCAPCLCDLLREHIYYTQFRGMYFSNKSSGARSTWHQREARGGNRKTLCCAVYSGLLRSRECQNWIEDRGGIERAQQRLRDAKRQSLCILICRLWLCDDGDNALYGWLDVA